MNERTMEYLRDRFGAYYESVPVSQPDTPVEREYAHIPWSTDPNPPMLRHRSQFDMDPFAETIAEIAPRHLYCSSALYDAPAANSMNEKGWKGADLVFDLDADHFDDVNPATDTLAEMLERCRRETATLLEILAEDLGFTDMTVAFSGRRGFHVHVRDEGVRPFEKAERREIVDYVTGADLSAEDVVREEAIGGEFGQKSATQRRFVDIDGGWGRRTWLSFLTFVDGAFADGEDAAIETFREFDGIGEKRATTAVNALQERRERAQTAIGDGDDGGLIAHPGIHTVFKRFVERDAAHGPEIDEPVTTDARRLMRLPGSLHGGSGLVACSIPRDEFDEFDPTVDAVPAPFLDAGSVEISLSEPTRTSVGADVRELAAGTREVPEHIGIHLMASGRAELAD